MSEMMVKALQSQVVGLQLARTQSNEIINKLMGQKLNEAARKELFQLVIQHCMEQDNSKAAQLTAVVRTAIMQLNTVAQSTADQRAKQQLVEVIKALTLTVECAVFEVQSTKISPRSSNQERER